VAQNLQKKHRGTSGGAASSRAKTAGKREEEIYKAGGMPALKTMKTASRTLKGGRDADGKRQLGQRKTPGVWPICWLIGKTAVFQ
jgi:hypothetical protein